jgi:hypothetical protein
MAIHKLTDISEKYAFSISRVEEDAEGRKE